MSIYINRRVKLVIIGVSGPTIGGSLSWYVAPQISNYLNVDTRHVSFLIMLAIGTLFAIILREKQTTDKENDQTESN